VELGVTGLAAGCSVWMNGYEVDIFEQHWGPPAGKREALEAGTPRAAR
jgi:hypothetical protein